MDAVRQALGAPGPKVEDLEEQQENAELGWTLLGAAVTAQLAPEQKKGASK